MAAAPLFILGEHADTAELPGFPRVLGWGIPAVLVMVAALPIGPPRTWLARCAVLVGDASYALYLTHVFVMIAYGWLLKSTGIGTTNQIPIVAIVVAVAIVTAVLAHLLVEQPLLAMVRRVTGRHPALVGPAIMPHSPP